jgi:hypothetical protein
MTIIAVAVAVPAMTIIGALTVWRTWDRNTCRRGSVPIMRRITSRIAHSTQRYLISKRQTESRLDFRTEGEHMADGQVGNKEYIIGDDARQRIENNFTYHSPISGQPERYTALREQAKELAYRIAAYTPASREQSLALTKLEEAIFWANAAIARNENA